MYLQNLGSYFVWLEDKEEIILKNWTEERINDSYNIILIRGYKYVCTGKISVLYMHHCRKLLQILEKNNCIILVIMFKHFNVFL